MYRMNGYGLDPEHYESGAGPYAPPSGPGRVVAPIFPGVIPPGALAPVQPELTDTLTGGATRAPVDHRPTPAEVVLPPLLAVPTAPLPPQPGTPLPPSDVATPPLPPPPSVEPPPPSRQPPGVLDKAKTWWEEQGTLGKVAVVGGAVAAIGLLWYMIAGNQRMTPNLRGAARKRVQEAKPGSRVKVGRKSYKVGKPIEIKGGRRFGHKVPPKRYRQQGATRPSDYAWPQGYKYPLVFRRADGKVNAGLSRKRTRAAASYYGKNKHLYPPKVRREIAKNINKAKKRFGIGGKPATP